MVDKVLLHNVKSLFLENMMDEYKANFGEPFTTETVKKIAHTALDKTLEEMGRSKSDHQFPKVGSVEAKPESKEININLLVDKQTLLRMYGSLEPEYSFEDFLGIMNVKPTEANND